MAGRVLFKKGLHWTRKGQRSIVSISEALSKTLYCLTDCRITEQELEEIHTAIAFACNAKVNAARSNEHDWDVTPADVRRQLAALQKIKEREVLEAAIECCDRATMGAYSEALNAICLLPDATWVQAPINDPEFLGMKEVPSVETMHRAAKAALENFKTQLGRREGAYKNDLVDVALMVWRNCEKRPKDQKAGAAEVRGGWPRRTDFVMRVLEAAGMHVGEDRVNQLLADAGGRPRFKKRSN